MILYSQNSLSVAPYREYSEASGAPCTSICFPNLKSKGTSGTMMGNTEIPGRSTYCISDCAYQKDKTKQHQRQPKALSPFSFHEREPN